MTGGLPANEDLLKEDGSMTLLDKKAHTTPDPDLPPPQPRPDPDDVPAPSRAPVEEPNLPTPPVKAE